MKTKIFALMLAVAMALLAFAGCQPSGDPSGSQSLDTSIPAESESDDTELLEITWMGFNQQGILPKDGSVIQKELEEKYNIKITNVPVDVYNADQLNLMLSTGVEFDVWTFASKDIAQAVETGLVQPIPDGYLDEYAPTFVETLDAIYPDWEKMATLDGKIYSIPLYSCTYDSRLSLAVRTDWLEALNVTTLPTTLDELETLLLRFRNDDPDGNDQKDTYALGKWWNTTSPLFTAAYVFAAYGCNVERWNIGDDGKPVHWAIMDEYKEGLKKVQDWYAKGIIHPEVITDTRVETTEKMVDNKIGGIFGTEWFIVGDNGNPSTPFAALVAADSTIDPATASTLIPPVKGPDGKAVTTPYWVPLARGFTFYFGKDASEAKMRRLLKLFDETLSDNDQFTQMWFGIEGEQFDKDAEGYVAQKADWATPEKMTEVGNYRYFVDHAFMPDKYLKLAFPKWRYETYMETIEYDVNPIHSVNAFTTAAETEFNAAIDKIQSEFFLQAMKGEVDIDEKWDSYVEQWLAAGGQQIIDAKEQLSEDMGLEG